MKKHFFFAFKTLSSCALFWLANKNHLAQQNLAGLHRIPLLWHLVCHAMNFPKKKPAPNSPVLLHPFSLEIHNPELLGSAIPIGSQFRCVFTNQHGRLMVSIMETRPIRIPILDMETMETPASIRYTGFRKKQKSPARDLWSFCSGPDPSGSFKKNMGGFVMKNLPSEMRCLPAVLRDSFSRVEGAILIVFSLENHLTVVHSMPVKGVTT